MSATYTDIARAVQDRVNRLVPYVCPQCGRLAAVRIAGSSVVCATCQVWATARPDLSEKGAASK